MTAPVFERTQTVTLVRAGTVDRFGNPTSGTEVDVAGCVVWPTGSTEIEGQQNTVSSDVTVLMPTGTGVRATDQFRYAGGLYDVVGEPQTFASPFTVLDPGIQVQGRKVTG